MSDRRRWYALGLLCTAAFMVILDAQIVLLALPSIEVALGFGPGGVQWVLSAYLLSFGGLLLLGGRAADLLGRRRMFMVGTALFTLASLLCGFAWSAGILVAARAVQGMSAAVMAPTALSILMTTFEEGPERNRALGVWTGLSGVGATAALLIGGPVAGALGWEWIFFLNVPVGVGLLVMSPVLLDESRAQARTKGFDVAGAVTITAALVMLVYAVVEAPAAGWLSLRTVGMLAAAVGLGALFVVVEARAAATRGRSVGAGEDRDLGPLVPPRILRSRALVGGNLVVLTLGMAAFGMSVMLSLYAQQVLGYSPLRFGLGTAVLTVMAVMGSTAGQHLVTRFGFRPIAVGGMALVAAGALLLTRVSADGDYLHDIFFGLLVFGPGLGAASVAGSIASLAGVAERESGLASGLGNTSFQIGGALGVAIVSTIAASQPGIAGFRAAFAAPVVFALVGLVAAGVLLGRRARRPAEAPAEAPAAEMITVS